jgi:hypothetical protein
MIDSSALRWPATIGLIACVSAAGGASTASTTPSAQAGAANAAAADLPACAADNTSAATWRVVTLPEVGQEHEIEVGGSVLTTARSGIAEAGLRITAEATAEGKRAGGDYVITIPPIELPSPTGYGNLLHPVRSATFRYAREKGERRGLSKPDISVYVDPANERALRGKVKFGLSSQDVAFPNARFTVDRCLKTNSKGFRREILYSGGSKGNIQLQYREYMNDFARPAFSQELSYDLANGTEIGFKGARIRVLSISNVGLRYVIVKALPDTAEQ